ncbi:MAG TPA: hypothetical protein PLD53_01535 [Candidatus Propionivibrio aalborgensis]|nr:hypothetical protein [Candidatus Propionivibrio aalborgensis]
MKLEDLGQDRGRQNLPFSDAKLLDDVEQGIITQVENVKQDCMEKLLEHLRTYKDRIAALGFEQKMFEFTNTANNALSDFKAKVHQGHDTLFQLRRDVVRIEIELIAFREKHQLERMAHYPESQLFHWSIITLILVLESILNGSFLARGHELGLIGGVIYALAISFVNVGSGLIAGYLLLPQLVHYAWWRKIAGGLAVIILAPFSISFNLAVAHYRDALGGPLSDDAMHTAWTSFLHNPLGIADIQSWLLFILGLAFFIIALLDGWKMDDPYPRYGRLARKQQTLNDDYAAEKSSLLNELELIRDEAVKKLNQIAEDIQHRKSEYETIIGARHKLTTSFQQHLRHLQQCGNELLAIYREANRRSRTTAIPSHFSETWTLQSPDLPAEVTEGRVSETTLENTVADKFGELKHWSNEIRSAYDTAVMEYRKIEQLTPEVLENGA